MNENLNIKPETTQKFNELLSILESEGIQKLAIIFSGSNGSGTIDDVLIPSDDEHFQLVPTDIEDQAINWTLDLLNDTGVDWVSDAGGYGNIEIDVALKDFGFRVFQNYTTGLLLAGREIGDGLMVDPQAAANYRQEEVS